MELIDASADVRINARLTGDDAQRFQALLKQSGATASKVLRAALREYHDRRQPPKRDPVKLLTGFVAAGEGPEDLSAHYKNYLTKDWAYKLHEASPKHGAD